MHAESIAQEAGAGDAGSGADESVQEDEMEVEEAGMQIPLAELGGSLAGEYKVAVMEDQSLEKWRVNADKCVNGFKWDQG